MNTLRDKAFKYDRLHKSLVNKLSNYNWLYRAFSPRFSSLRQRLSRLEMTRFAYTAMMLAAARQVKKEKNQ